MTAISKKSFLFSLFRGFFLFLAVLYAGPGTVESALAAEPVEEETLLYDISFLIFRNAAVGSLTVRYLPGRDLYEGTVIGETKGFISWMSFARKDTYRSLMRLSPDGKKLIPVEFSQEVRTWAYRVVSKTVLDYETGIMRWEYTEDVSGETSVEARSHPIPPGVIYEDFISAFLNLRRGSYGPLRPGREIKLFSLPTRKWFKENRKAPPRFKVKISGQEAQRDSGSILSVSVNIPDDLFGQKVGIIRFLLRQDLVPSHIVVENVLLFGDMKGSLRSRRIHRKEIATARKPPGVSSPSGRPMP